MKSSYLWNKITKRTLTRNLRVELNNGSKSFADLLLDIGDGIDGENLRLPASFFTVNHHLDDFAKEVFPKINTNLRNYEYLKGRAIICPTNEQVKEVNTVVLKMLNGTNLTYESTDSIADENLSHEYPVEFLNSISLNGLPDHILEIKKNSIIMLLINLDKGNGHVNGVRYQVLNAGKYVIEAIAITGKAAGKKLFIPRITSFSRDTQLPFIMKRKQFPVR